MSIDITHICLLFCVFLTINKIRLPKVMVSQPNPSPFWSLWYIWESLDKCLLLLFLRYS